MLKEKCKMSPFVSCLSLKSKRHIIINSRHLHPYPQAFCLSPKLELREQSQLSRMPSEIQRPTRSTASGGSRRDSSPESLVYTPESNLSLFSSASVSVDRCSSTSDAHDRDSLISAPSPVKETTNLNWVPRILLKTLWILIMQLLFHCSSFIDDHFKL